MQYGFHMTPDDRGYEKTTASRISNGLSIAADKGILPLRLSSIVLAACSSALFFYHTGSAQRCCSLPWHGQLMYSGGCDFIIVQTWQYGQLIHIGSFHFAFQNLRASECLSFSGVS
jgi:hypothetical protein